jgi:hypothetical protein
MGSSPEVNLFGNYDDHDRKEKIMSKVEMVISAAQEAAKAKRRAAFIQDIAEAELKNELDGVDAQLKTESELEAAWEARERNHLPMSGAW